VLVYVKGELMNHWTDLFKEYPELFFDALDERVAQAGIEVDFLLKCLHKHRFKTQSVLDLNCGIGRHSIELGRRGIAVLGTDLSPHYIDVAKKRAENEGVAKIVSFKVADMRRIASSVRGQRFDGIINLFTSFGYYDDDTNNDILRQCSSLVRPGGFFALEILNRDWLVRNFQPRGFTRYKGLILLEDRKFDIETSRVQATWTFLKQQSEKQFVLEKQITIDTRLWSLHELALTFSRSGWKFQVAYPRFGSQDKNVALTEAQRLLFLARKK